MTTYIFVDNLLFCRIRVDGTECLKFNLTNLAFHRMPFMKFAVAVSTEAARRGAEASTGRGPRRGTGRAAGAAVEAATGAGRPGRRGLPCP